MVALGAHLGRGQVRDGQTGPPLTLSLFFPSFFFETQSLSLRLICIGLQHNEGLLAATFFFVLTQRSSLQG